MSKIVLSQLARSDLHAISRYIMRDNPRAAKQIIEHLRKAIHSLESSPLRFRPGRVENTREMPLLKTYLVVYTVDTDSIKILRILHSSQQWPPDY